jgi:acetyl-CoA C-acetyltransferase
MVSPTAPVGAVNKLLKKIGWASAMLTFGVNRAFAVVPMALMKA